MHTGGVYGPAQTARLTSAAVPDSQVPVCTCTPGTQSSVGGQVNAQPLVLVLRSRRWGRTRGIGCHRAPGFLGPHTHEDLNTNNSMNYRKNTTPGHPTAERVRPSGRGRAGPTAASRSREGVAKVPVLTLGGLSVSVACDRHSWRAGTDVLGGWPQRAGWPHMQVSA